MRAGRKQRRSAALLREPPRRSGYGVIGNRRWTPIGVVKRTADGEFVLAVRSGGATVPIPAVREDKSLQRTAVPCGVRWVPEPLCLDFVRSRANPDN